MNYDIIIPTIYRDFPFLIKIVEYINKNLTPSNIYIIANKEKSRFLPKKILAHKHCIALDEDKLLEGLDYDHVRKILKDKTSNPRTGWYFQQFLKMGFALSKYAQHDYYLTWDSDTLPLQPINFFGPDNHPLFTMKSEYHKPYFNSLNRLIGLGKLNNSSYIAEHMIISKTIMKELIEDIEKSTIPGGVWYEKIINSIDKGEQYGFSEFETYGTYCLHNYPELYHERVLPSFRYGGFIQGRLVNETILKKLSFDLAIVSFEPYHTPPFPWGQINNLYYKYLNKKEWFIEKFLL